MKIQKKVYVFRMVKTQTSPQLDPLEMNIGEVAKWRICLLHPCFDGFEQWFANYHTPPYPTIIIAAFRILVKQEAPTEVKPR